MHSRDLPLLFSMLAQSRMAHAEAAEMATSPCLAVIHAERANCRQQFLKRLEDFASCRATRGEDLRPFQPALRPLGHGGANAASSELDLGEADLMQAVEQALDNSDLVGSCRQLVFDLYVVLQAENRQNA